MSETILDLLREYFLRNELKPETEAYYRRIVNVLNTWAGRVLLRSEFSPDKVSEFLQAKYAAGVSSHYRKSLRNGLRALLNFDGKSGPIRSVRLGPLSFDCWLESDVARLIGSVNFAIQSSRISTKAQHRRWYWRNIIPVAWYTGLAAGDLWRLDSRHVSASGLVVINRSRTGKRAVVSIPPELAEKLLARGPGPWFTLNISQEMFRQEFAKIVKAAGLVGTFKKLRKSSGTAVEILHPGRGHEHLANSRAIFEKHYLAVSAMPLKPLSPPRLTG